MAARSRMPRTLTAAIFSTALATAAHQAEAVEATIAVAEAETARIAAGAFETYVEAASDGEIQVNIVIHEAIGGARAATDQLRVGELQFNFADAPGFVGIIPELQTYSWPFLFPNRSVFYELMSDAEYVADLQAVIEERSNGTLRFFGAGENSIRNLYTTRGPVRVPEDLTEHAIKMRTRELVLDQELFAALGAPAVVALPAPERYTGLQTGLIDGTDGGLESAWVAGLLEVAEYVTLTGHAYDYFFLLGDRAFYDELSPDMQAVIDEGARLMTWVNNGRGIVAEQAVQQEMLDAGINIYVPTPSELAEWRALAEPVGRRVIQENVDEAFVETTLDAITRIESELEQRAGR